MWFCASVGDTSVPRTFVTRPLGGNRYNVKVFDKRLVRKKFRQMNVNVNVNVRKKSILYRVFF